MRLYDQETIWVHGSAFVVRRVHHRTGNYVIFYCGQYLARVRKRELKSWLNYFAKRLLTTGKL